MSTPFRLCGKNKSTGWETPLTYDNREQMGNLIDIQLAATLGYVMVSDCRILVVDRGVDVEAVKVEFCARCGACQCPAKAGFRAIATRLLREKIAALESQQWGAPLQDRLALRGVLRKFREALLVIERQPGSLPDLGGCQSQRSQSPQPPLLQLVPLD